MSDNNPAPVAPDATSVEIPIPIDIDAAPVPTKPEFISETLYIQNLNEKIRIDGPSPSSFTYTRVYHLLQSSNHLCGAFSSRTVRYSTWWHTTTCGCADKRLFHLRQRMLPKKL